MSGVDTTIKKNIPGQEVDRLGPHPRPTGSCLFDIRHGSLRLDRALLSDKEAAAFLGIGKTTLWGMLSTGELGPQPVKIRALTKWNRRELLAWLDAGLPNADRWLPMWREIRGAG